jgi:FkbM family methyltransferase
LPYLSLKQHAIRVLGRTAPSVLRFLAQHYPGERGRWPALSVLREDPKCRAWLASLENPTRTRHGFRIFTLPGDLTSDWIRLFGQHETGTEAFLTDHLQPGTTFLDIGANVGYFALLAAANSGASVVAFEPQRAVAGLLQQSAEFNRLGGVIRVEAIALSNASAEMKMTSCPGNSGHAQLTALVPTDEASNIVPVMALDEWLRQNPTDRVSACKIDTEGGEFNVLQGMAGLMDRDGPAIVVEVIDEFLAAYGSSDSLLLELLGAHGYREVTAKYGTPGDRNRYFVKDRKTS